MPMYYISALRTGSIPADTLGPDVFAAALRSRWPVEDLRPTVDARNPWTLEWAVRLGSETVTGRLGREDHRVAVSGTTDAVATFAVWYRTLIPGAWHLALGELEPWDSWWLELTVASGEETVSAALAARPRSPRRRAAPAWRAALGGHLGNLSREYGDAVFAIFCTPTDELWVGLTAIGRSRLLVHRVGAWEYTPTGRVEYDARFSAFAWSRGHLWVDAGRDALLVRDRGRWERVAVPGSGSPTALVADADGTLWLAGSSGGLLRSSDGNTWERMPLPGGESVIGALCTAGGGGLWVATGTYLPGGTRLYHRHGDGWRAVPMPDKRGSLRVTALAADGAGALWVGTSGDSVWRLDERGWRRFGYTLTGARPGLPGNSVSRLLVDAHQHLWAAADGGVARYDGAVWRWTFPVPDPLGDERILALWKGTPEALHLDQRGRLWIGGRHGAVAWIDATRPLYDDLLSYTLVDYQPTFAAPPAEPPLASERQA